MLRALALVCAVACLVAPAAGSGDRGSVAALQALVATAEAAARAAAGGRGGSDAVQRQYDAARDLEEGLRSQRNRAGECRAFVLAAERYARGLIEEAEGVDRLQPASAENGGRHALDGLVARGRYRDGCTSGSAPARLTESPELLEPRPGAAFFGLVRAAAPRRATRAVLDVGDRVVAVAAPAEGRVRFRLRLPPGRYDIRVRFVSRRGYLARSESRGVWLLPAASRRAAPERSVDGRLRARLGALGRGFAGYAGFWVHDLVTGRTAGWNSDARFAAASTVKLGVLVAALQRFGPGQTSVAYDLRALTAWSSNLASNRLLVRLGGSESAGGRIATETLWRLGARSSTFPGGYRVGTATRADAPRQPPLDSSRVTTAHDLGRVLAVLHGAAAGNGLALRTSGLSQESARLALGLLLASEPAGDNVGLLREALGPKALLAQKHGWISTARHTAAILYSPRGPRVVVLLVARPGLSLPDAAALGRRLVALLP